MEENNKGIIWLIIILIILVLGLVGYIVYDKVILNDKIPVNNDNTTSTTINNTIQSNVNLPKKYEIKKKEAIKFEFNKNYSDNQKDLIEYIEYPVINGDDESIVNLNKTILQNVDKVINELKDEGKIVTDNEYNDLCYLKIQDDGQKKEYCEYTLLEYNIKSSSKYLTIIEEESGKCLNCTGYQLPLNFYIIDKTTNKMINNSEIISSIDNLSELKNDLINFIKNNFENFDYFTYIEKSKFIRDISNLINNDEYIIYYDNEELVFYFKEIQDTRHVLFSFSEEEGWEDSTWQYMP